MADKIEISRSARHSLSNTPGEIGTECTQKKECNFLGFGHIVHLTDRDSFNRRGSCVRCSHTDVMTQIAKCRDATERYENLQMRYDVLLSKYQHLQAAYDALNENGKIKPPLLAVCKDRSLRYCIEICPLAYQCIPGVP